MDGYVQRQSAITSVGRSEPWTSTSLLSPSLHMVRSLVFGVVAALAAFVAADEKLQIGVKFKPADCPIKSQKGDKLS